MFLMNKLVTTDMSDIEEQVKMLLTSARWADREATKFLKKFNESEPGPDRDRYFDILVELKSRLQSDCGRLKQLMDMIDGV